MSSESWSSLLAVDNSVGAYIKLRILTYPVYGACVMKTNIMRVAFCFVITASALAFQAVAVQASPADVLDANRHAAVGKAWIRDGAIILDYSYSGQGLTGAVHTQYDLSGLGFKDSYEIGSTTGANGFDGTNAWQEDQSGVVSKQQAGDILSLEFNEAYRDANLWWLPGRGAARIKDQGPRTEGELTFDVLHVSPQRGKPFEAWFDAKSHLLARTVEVQGSQIITTSFSDYAPVDGMQIAHTLTIDDGTGPENRQTQILTTARVSPSSLKSSYAAPSISLHDSTIAGSATETSAPFQLINNHIYADVSVNGAKPELFIFDTGGHASLSTTLAASLNISATGRQEMTGGGAGFSQTGVAQVASLSIGAATITNQPVTVAGFFAAAPSVEGVNAQGMLGYEFFARFVTRIDYGARTITFIDPKHFVPTDAGVAIPLLFFNQMPVVNGSYNGISAQFHIDTGARMPLMLTGPFVAQHNLRTKATRGVESLVGIGVGGPSFGFVTHGGVLKIGDVMVDAPLTIFNLDKGGSGAADAFPNNIGAGILKRFVVTLDYGNYLIYLKPIPGLIADLDTFDRSGMWINGDGDGFKILYISAGTPAEQAGLKPGDLIVGVNGKPAAELRLFDVRQQLRDDPPGTVIKLEVKSGSETRDISIALRDLF